MKLISIYAGATGWARVVCGALCLALFPIAAVAQLKPVVISSTGKVDGVTVVLTKAGPYPQSFTHVTGSFLLSVVNRSGVLVDTFSLVQTPASGTAGATPGASLLDLHSTLTQQRDAQLVNPQPGSYQIRFQAHPDWAINITITAN